MRRFYLALVSVVLMVSLTLFLVLPQTVNTWAASVSEVSSLVRIVLAVLFDVVLLALLYIQVKPDPRTQVTGLMMQASGAITEVGVESARARILKAVNEVSDIVSADAEVKPVHGRADVELHVTVMGNNVQLPAKQKEINRALNQVIHKQLGLRLAGQPRVHIRFHGEEVVKPSVPVVTHEPIKPVEVIAAAKPISVELEPQKSLGFFGRPHREAVADDTDGVFEDIVVKNPEVVPKLDSSLEVDKEQDELAGSSTEDVVMAEPGVQKDKDDEEDAPNSMRLNNHPKESEPQ